MAAMGEQLYINLCDKPLLYSSLPQRVGHFLSAITNSLPPTQPKHSGVVSYFLGNCVETDGHMAAVIYTPRQNVLWISAQANWLAEC